MGSAVPKQFLLINDRPIIVETIRQFYAFDPTIHLIVVLPKDHMTQWQDIKKEYFPTNDIQATVGGATRSASVKNGLGLATGNGLVAIHDAVRPYVEVSTIKQSFDAARAWGSGVACVPLKDSIREIDNDSSTARDRSKYVLVQTPQTFHLEQLKQAYQSVQSDQTDDATVFEMAGHKVHLIDGTYSNIKITTPEDL